MQTIVAIATTAAIIAGNLKVALRNGRLRSLASGAGALRAVEILNHLQQSAGKKFDLRFTKKVFQRIAFFSVKRNVRGKKKI